MNRTLRLASAVLALALMPIPASANGTLNAEYFLLPGNHPDVNHGIDGTIVTGLFAKSLGPHHLPVLTTLGRTYSGSSGPIHDTDAAGEVLWYSSASRYHVHRIRIAEEKLPFERDSFYPPGKTANGGANGYLAVHWSGTFSVAKAQAVTFKLGSDDDSWVYIDGNLVVDNGGVKPMQTAPFVTAKLPAGAHAFDVFYADRHGSGAAIELSAAFPLAPPGRKAPTLAQQLHSTGHVTVYGIHFDFDRATITKDSAGVLAEVASALRADRALRLRIEGHTDNAGNADYNRDLSRRRAEAVKAYLVSRDAIVPGRLATQGFGPDRPVAANTAAEGRAKNRRVELVRI